MSLDRLAPLVKGILNASSTVNDALTSEGIRYSVTHEVSDDIHWECGEFELTKLETAPRKLKQALQLKEIDEKTLSLWTVLDTLVTDEMTDDAQHHQNYLQARIFDSIPPGIFVIPDDQPQKTLTQDIEELSPDILDPVSEEEDSKAIDQTDTSNVVEIEDAGSQSRRGRRPIRDDEIALDRVQKVLTRFYTLRKEDPSKQIGVISEEIDREFGVAPRTLREWDKNYKELFGL
jgi:hypothetical protein